MKPSLVIPATVETCIVTGEEAPAVTLADNVTSGPPLANKATVEVPSCAAAVVASLPLSTVKEPRPSGAV